MVRRRFSWIGGLSFTIIFCVSAWSQTADKTTSSADERLIQSITALQAQVDQLNSQLSKMREDEEKLRAEMLELRRHASSVGAAESGQAPVEQSDNYTAVSDPSRIENSSSDPPALAEKVDFLEKKVNEQYQTKLESGSKYRVGFSGLVLLNLFANRGNVDSIDNPSIAKDIDPIDRARGSVGGTLRQTQFGFQVNGPNVFGARASGNVQFDFSGGPTPAPGGDTMGVVRLRTGTVRLDWQNTSFVAGQDSLFFVPLAPTSYASINQPALTYAGELWGWIPQARIEQRLGPNVTVKAGILDPVDDQLADNSVNTRSAGPGEQTRMPGFGAHVGWSHQLFGRTVSFGGGGYYGKQQFQIQIAPNAPPNQVVSWLGSADWEIPVSHYVVLSGSLYRGSALGGLGGGLGQSVVYMNTPGSLESNPLASVKGLSTEGGWAQLKIQPFQKFEWNFAVGDDNPFASQLASGSAPDYLDEPLSRNRAAFGNVIYRPRSDLLLALEFRHIESFVTRNQSVQAFPAANKSASANQVNLGMGIMF